MKSQLNIGVISGYRRIKNGEQYNSYFPSPDASDRIIIEDGDVEDTVDLMKRVVWRYIDDTKKIAPTLLSQSKEQTCNNIWSFLFHHIQYRLDQKGLEQLRRPARSWADRKHGIDCDCFSIFASSILTNLKIPHAFRITKYGGDHFQHVYVVVKTKGKTFIIDPVLSNFNYEKPFTEHKDFDMNLSGIDVAVLSGHNDQLNEVLFGPREFEELGFTSDQQQLDAMYRYLVSTRSTIAQNPDRVRLLEDPGAFVKMLDYAIQYWHTDQRDEALEVLIQNEEKLNLQNGYSIYDDDEHDESLGRVKRSFFKKVGTYVNNTSSGIKNTAKNVAKAVIRYNPIAIAARVGFLAAMKLNLAKMASKIKWGYASQNHAISKGISSSDWTRAKAALSQIERLFSDRLQGKQSALKNAILNGRAGGLDGVYYPGSHLVNGLGEPVSLSAAITAATPVIIAAVKILKDTGLLSRNDNVSAESLKAEAMQAQNGSNTRNSSSASLPPSPPPPNNMIRENTPNTLPETTHSSSDGVMRFVKNNPVVIAVGAGAVLIGGYMLFKPAKKTRRSLSGTRKSPIRKTPVRRKTTIKRVTLK